jgi:hypothetical protein
LFRRAVVLALCLVVVGFFVPWSGSASAVTVFPAAGDWTTPGVDSANTYNNTAESTITPANVSRLSAAWTDNGLGGDTNQLLSDGGRLFIDGGQSIIALDAGTGQKLWTWGNVRGPISSIVAYNGLIYAGLDSYQIHTQSGYELVSAIVALDEKSGALKWVDPRLDAEGTNVHVPLAAGGGRIYAAFSDGAAAGIDAATGKQVWFDSQTDFHIFAAGFAYSGGHLVGAVGTRGGGSYAALIDPANGHLGSQSVLSDRGATIIGNRIIAESSDGVAAAALNGCAESTCPALWQNRDLQNDVSNVAVSSRYVVVGRGGSSQSPVISVLDINTGRQLWSVPTGPTWAQVAIAGQVIYATSESGGNPSAAAYPLNGCGAATCAPLWRVKLAPTCDGCAPAVVSHGTLYLSEENNQTTKLAALRPPVATAYGPAFAHLGSTVVIDGTAPPGSTVTVWFHKRNATGYVQRRLLRASKTGVWSTTYQPNDDYRYYARAAGTTSPSVLTQISPTISGPSRIAAGHTVTITGTDRPGAQLHVWFHRRDSTGYVVRRTVTASSSGRWSSSYVANDDYRYYATDLSTGLRSATVLTQIG